MARRKRPGKREGYGLPFAVLRGIVRDNRFAPPANRYASFRLWAERKAERLARVDKRVWQLDIDWRKYASQLDQCAKQEVLKRTDAQEAKKHARIAQALRKAANLLGENDQSDPTLWGTVQVLAKYYDKDRYEPFVPKGTMQPNTPHLSDFLRATASFIEGEKVRVFGVHASALRYASGPLQVGKKGAAIRAAESVRKFFLRHTGKPHNDLMVSVVSSYYPDVQERDWVSTLDKRAREEANRKS